MNVSQPALRRSLKSDLARVDAHVVQKGEYDELPELTDELLGRARLIPAEEAFAEGRRLIGSHSQSSES